MISIDQNKLLKPDKLSIFRIINANCYENVAFLCELYVIFRKKQKNPVENICDMFLPTGFFIKLFYLFI